YWQTADGAMVSVNSRIVDRRFIHAQTSLLLALLLGSPDPLAAPDAVLRIDDRGVAPTLAAVHELPLGVARLDRVVARAAAVAVLPRASDERVPASAADELVAPPATLQHVVAARAVELVVATAAVEMVVPIGPG